MRFRRRKANAKAMSERGGAATVPRKAQLSAHPATARQQYTPARGKTTVRRWCVAPSLLPSPTGPRALQQTRFLGSHHVHPRCVHCALVRAAASEKHQRTSDWYRLMTSRLPAHATDPQMNSMTPSHTPGIALQTAGKSLFSVCASPTPCAREDSHEKGRILQRA